MSVAAQPYAKNLLGVYFKQPDSLIAHNGGATCSTIIV